MRFGQRADFFGCDTILCKFGIIHFVEGGMTFMESDSDAPR